MISNIGEAFQIDAKIGKALKSMIGDQFLSIYYCSKYKNLVRYNPNENTLGITDGRKLLYFKLSTNKLSDSFKYFTITNVGKNYFLIPVNTKLENFPDFNSILNRESTKHSSEKFVFDTRYKAESEILKCSKYPIDIYTLKKHVCNLGEFTLNYANDDSFIYLKGDDWAYMQVTLNY